MWLLLFSVWTTWNHRKKGTIYSAKVFRRLIGFYGLLHSAYFESLKALVLFYSNKALEPQNIDGAYNVTLAFPHLTVNVRNSSFLIQSKSLVSLQVTRTQSELLLFDKPNGTFIVRASQHLPNEMLSPTTVNIHSYTVSCVWVV